MGHSSPLVSAGSGCLLQVAWQGDRKMDTLSEPKKIKRFIWVLENNKKTLPLLK